MSIRLLLLTGCRKGEILNLRWSQVDLENGELHLPETKTGPRTIVLSPEAASVLARIPRLADNPFVIPGKIGGKAMRNLNDPWEIVCARAGLEDMRLHDCRHSYASRALALGESLPMIGRLLGHTQVETTARYAHLAKDSVRDAVRVRLTFDTAVDVTGTPRLQIDLQAASGGEKWAVYESGSGTTELTFAYAVAEPDAASGPRSSIRSTNSPRKPTRPTKTAANGGSSAAC